MVLSFEDFEKHQIYVRHHETYFRIAKNNLRQAVALEIEAGRIATKAKRTKRENEKLVDSVAGIEECSITAIVFSVMTLEAFINDYAIRASSINYLENYLDKLDLSSKFILFPRLFTGTGISTDGQALELLKKRVLMRICG